jgi:hypothetical protein
LVLGLPDGALVMVCRLIWIAGATVIAVSWSRLWRMVPFVVAGAAVVAALGAHYAVLSRPGAEPVEQVASIIRGNLRPGDRWSAYDVFLRNLPFYVKVPESHAFDAAGLLALVQSSTHVVVAIRQEDLTRFEARFGLRLRRLGEIPYVNTSKLKLARVLRPDPVRDIQTVLVVSNR